MCHHFAPDIETVLLILLRPPPIVFSGRPLSDPFAAEAKTVEDESTVCEAPHKAEAEVPPTISSSTAVKEAGVAEPLVVKDPPVKARTSTEISGIPRLSKTFVAKVRATARSPPPV